MGSSTEEDGKKRRVNDAERTTSPELAIPWLAVFAIAVFCASAIPAAAQAPEFAVPGTSPAGKIAAPTPRVAAGQPTPTAKPDPSGGNLPKGEPVEPKAHPGDVPNLPGSGAREAVPGRPAT
jgi:hypothetical protein